MASSGIVGQGHRSKVKVKRQKLCFDITAKASASYLALRSRSKVRVKVKGRGQGHRSKVKVTLLACSGRYWGPALPSAAKSKEESSPTSRRYLSVCRIITQMWSIGFD